MSSENASPARTETSLTVVCAASGPEILRGFLHSVEMTEMVESRDRRLLQSLCHIGGLERANHLLEIPVDDAIQVIERQSDAVVGQAVLRKIVSRNFFLAPAGADLPATLPAV